MTLQSSKAISQVLAVAIVIAIVVSAFGGYYFGSAVQARTGLKSIPAETITEVVSVDSTIGGGGGGCLGSSVQNNTRCASTLNLTSRNTTIFIVPSNIGQGYVNATLTKVTSYGDLYCSNATTFYTTYVGSSTTQVAFTWHYQTCT